MVRNPLREPQTSVCQFVLCDNYPRDVSKREEATGLISALPRTVRRGGPYKRRKGHIDVLVIDKVSKPSEN
jgi:hypothetical protein